MPEFLTDPSWLEVILAVAGLFLAWYFFVRDRKIKRLSYRIIQKTKLVGDTLKATTGIKVFYDNMVLDDLYLFELEVMNDGNVPIQRNDFDKAITLVPTKNAIIYSVEIESETVPVNDLVHEIVHVGGDHVNQTEAILVPQNHMITMQKHLFNKGEAVRYKLMANTPNPVQLEGRIVGAPPVKQKYSTFTLDMHGARLMGVVALGVGMVTGFIVTLIMISDSISRSSVTAVFVTLLATAAILAGVETWVENKDKHG